MKKIAITIGDPNGIGMEITAKALNNLDLPSDNVILISNKKIIQSAPKLTKTYEIIEIPFEGEIQFGKITKESGDFAFNSVKKACELANLGEISAIVTAPTAKNAMYLAGHQFNGQTEILQKYLAHNNQLAEMLFVANNFRVLLLTRHVALKNIQLTDHIIFEKICNLKEFFEKKLNITNPKFALCGFNPHAGENGLLGREENDILIPAIKALREKTINITNPLPADTLFVQAANDYFQNTKPLYDCYIANYHDQGLIPIKTIAGKKTVNMTIGLDVIRTSPGHGTAFDIAGKNIADETSMIEAIKAALNT